MSLAPFRHHVANSLNAKRRRCNPFWLRWCGGTGDVGEDGTVVGAGGVAGAVAGPGAGGVGAAGSPSLHRHVFVHTTVVHAC